MMFKSSSWSSVLSFSQMHLIRAKLMTFYPILALTTKNSTESKERNTLGAYACTNKIPHSFVVPYEKSVKIISWCPVRGVDVSRGE